jgi:di- and tripeptidase
MLAALVAVAGLDQRNDGPSRLRHNVRFIVEGEEECGSTGTMESVKNNKQWLGRTDLLIVSNNSWIDSENPCVVYGLRGVIHFGVTVSGPERSNHSGVDGGAYREPLIDLVHCLGHLTDPVTAGVSIPHFHDKVRALSSDESKLYSEIAFDVDNYAKKAGITGLLLYDDANELLQHRYCFKLLLLALF